MLQNFRRRHRRFRTSLNEKGNEKCVTELSAVFNGCREGSIRKPEPAKRISPNWRQRPATIPHVPENQSEQRCVNELPAAFGSNFAGPRKTRAGKSVLLRYRQSWPVISHKKSRRTKTLVLLCWRRRSAPILLKVPLKFWNQGPKRKLENVVLLSYPRRSTLISQLAKNFKANNTLLLSCRQHPSPWTSKYFFTSHHMQQPLVGWGS